MKQEKSTNALIEAAGFQLHEGRAQIVIAQGFDNVDVDVDEQVSRLIQLVADECVAAVLEFDESGCDTGFGMSKQDAVDAIRARFYRRDAPAVTPRLP
jgi:hypothetical protein